MHATTLRTPRYWLNEWGLVAGVGQGTIARDDWDQEAASFGCLTTDYFASDGLAWEDLTLGESSPCQKLPQLA